ncbi:MAG: DUF2652 domain-containing protein [Actinomycetota bacterium]|nr:DUF2652 domain-containing protein [Actinomycetota bacterium]
MASTFRAEAAEGPLLLADISGYTAFLQAVAEAHRDDAFANGAVPEAYRLMSSLLDGIVGRIVPPFTLSKIEGDAVFVFATAGPGLPTGESLLDTIRGCYADFRSRLTEVGAIWACSCTACLRATSLDLKFVLHAGRYVLQQIAGSRELSGPDVVMAHRLLKNGAADLVGHDAYALISASAASRLGIPTAGAEPITETYQHYPPISAFALALR